jgi:RNA binding exosome subunit
MIHNVSYRAFVYGTENEEKVKKAIKTLFPNSLIQCEVTEGHYKTPVLILYDKINKKRDIKNFIETLNSIGSYDKKRILRDLEKKMDDKGNFFLRFDKQKAYLGELEVVEHGDSIHVKIKMAAYPAKKEPAMKLANKLLGVN